MSDEPTKDACHVVNRQLKCDACGTRIRSDRLRGYSVPFYPFCPWCGAPVTVEAQKTVMQREGGRWSRRLSST